MIYMVIEWVVMLQHMSYYVCPVPLSRPVPSSLELLYVPVTESLACARQLSLPNVLGRVAL